MNSTAGGAGGAPLLAVPCTFDAMCVWGGCNTTTGICNNCLLPDALLLDAMWLPMPGCIIPEWAAWLMYATITLLSLPPIVVNARIFREARRKQQKLSMYVTLAAVTGNMCTILYMLSHYLGATSTGLSRTCS